MSAELIDAYLNGPRTLSNARLSYLVVSHAELDPASTLLTPPPTPSPSFGDKPSRVLNDDLGLPQSQFDLLICAMHFIGDGMALHTFANDFFSLLGSKRTDAELEEVLRSEWQERWQHTDISVSPNSIQ